MTSEYYRKVYEQFKECFGDLPHIIAGRQFTKVPDDHVAAGIEGVPEETYQQWLRQSRVMFYHSQEPRHLHYHPLEAIACKTPLIFMKGGLLEKQSSRNQPGACSTLKEAREKVYRVLSLDMNLIEEIQAAQIDLLSKFRMDFIQPVWYVNMSQILDTPI